LKNSLLIVVVIASVGLLRAEDWTTIDGQSYKNVRVISHDAGYVTIMDDAGGGRIMLSELPPALRARFGFDPLRASAFVAATEAVDQQNQADFTAKEQQADAALAPTSLSGPQLTDQPQVQPQSFPALEVQNENDPLAADNASLPPPNTEVLDGTSQTEIIIFENQLVIDRRQIEEIRHAIEEAKKTTGSDSKIADLTARQRTLLAETNHLEAQKTAAHQRIVAAGSGTRPSTLGASSSLSGQHLNSSSTSSAESHHPSPLPVPQAPPRPRPVPVPTSTTH
jgi:hypothetical protein